MITAEFDMAKLRRSISKAAKKFGETNRDAIARWGVQTCRELATTTQAFGKAGTKKKQQDAIEAGAKAVVWPVKITGAARGSTRFEYQGTVHYWPNSRVLRDPAAVNDWIEKHRTAKNKRTPKQALPFHELAICDERVFRAAMKIRFARAGEAKGAWLGAGMEIAKRQRGTQRINIGKNFLGYAQRHSGKGTASVSGNPFKTFGTLTNNAAHSASSYVLSESNKSKAIAFGARKTIQWYKKAARDSLNKA